ncbi:MAG: hypothetical protein AAF211_05680, partial [Myxococcota bacterium]
MSITQVDHLILGTGQATRTLRGRPWTVTNRQVGPQAVTQGGTRAQNGRSSRPEDLMKKTAIVLLGTLVPLAAFADPAAHELPH